MLSEYFEAGGSFCITCPCALEVFSVLKVKHFYRKELTREECVFASHAFSAHLRDQLKVEPCGFHGASLFFEVEALARRHNLDIVDGIQMHALLRGRFSHFAGSHKNLLIIADEELAAAARAEGIDVWDCMHEPGPTHWGPTTRASRPLPAGFAGWRCPRRFVPRRRLSASVGRRGGRRYTASFEAALCGIASRFIGRRKVSRCPYLDCLMLVSGSHGSGSHRGRQRGDPRLLGGLDEQLRGEDIRSIEVAL